MNNRTLIDLLCIIAFFAIYFVLSYLAVQVHYDLTAQLRILPGEGMDVADLNEEFIVWSQLAMGVSFLAALAWYALGEWGLKAHTTSSGTWLLVWLLGLGLALAGGYIAFNQFVDQASPSENAQAAAFFYVGCGAVFYILTTLLFSPVHIKYVVPGSRYIRRW